MEAAPKKSSPAANFTEEVLVKILRCLPVRSVCRFKCVSRSWNRLISNSDNRVPQTLSGFFYESLNFERFPIQAYHFTNVTGKGKPFIYPSFLSFMPVPSEEVDVIDSCNGLLLCRCFEPGPRDGKELLPFYLVVCNPATKKWLMLPYSNRAPDVIRAPRLAFDPTVSSHFHVIQYVVAWDETEDVWGRSEFVIGVEIYSSRTAAWSFKESKWGDDLVLDHTSRSVFLNGFMHMLTYYDKIIAVDMEGKTWRKIPTRGEDTGSIHRTQGRLCLLNVGMHNLSGLSIWMLEDYSTNKWTLKHTVTTMQLFRQKNIRFDIPGPGGYKVIAVHPEYSLIFFVFGRDNTLMTYEMDRKEVRVICNLGRDCGGLHDIYLPYVPLFLEALAEE